MELEDWRREIDSIDARIVGLLNERAKIAQKIGVLKSAAGLPVVDTAREKDVLRRVAGCRQDFLNREAVTRIFRVVISESRIIQAETKSGVEGGKQAV